MRFLLVNDDGIDAPGIALLEAVAAELASEIWVVAPRDEQSGRAQAVTIADSIAVQQRGQTRYAVSGTPVDCVRVALGNLMSDSLPDFVLSGVNGGGNVGVDVAYSGTCGAAFEGVRMGIPSLAFSQLSKDGGVDFSAARTFLPGLLQQLIALKTPPPVLWSVNFPSCLAEEVTGVHSVVQDDQIREDRLTLLDESGSTQRFCLPPREPLSPDWLSDVGVVAGKGIAVTPLQPFNGHNADFGKALATRFTL